MVPLFHIIKGTPLYVWPILAYLLFIGIKSLKPHIVYLPKLFLLPVIMLAMKYKVCLSAHEISPFLTLLLGTIASFFMHLRKKIKVIVPSQSIELPGSCTTLIIVLSFFCIKYFFGFLKAKHNAWILPYAYLENTISLLFSGYLLGKAACFTYKYFKNC